jgi:sugar phosphate isomerase/epimerase
LAACAAAYPLGVAGVLHSAGEARAAPVPGGWRIGIYTRPWGAYPYTVALDAMAEAGYQYAGLMTTKSRSGLVISTETTLEEAAAVGQEVKKRGLALLSVYGGGFPVQRGLAAGIDGLRRLIDNCAAANCPSLLLGGNADPKLEDAYYRAIAECCDYAAEKQVMIALKPHGPLNATGPELRKVMDRVGNKNFRVWYDPGNICYYSHGRLDPAVDAASVAGLVAGMCVKDYLPPKPVEAAPGAPKPVELGRVDVTPGSGAVNFPAVMTRLKQDGFTAGSLVIECLAPGDRTKLVAEARQARRFVEKLVGAG